MGYVIILLAVLGILLWQRQKSRKLLQRLNQMVDTAIEGNFTENSFDESLLSALECKLARYLASSATSAKQVQSKKDKLKALIADISHQTKTPISNILLYTQLLQEQSIDPACLQALESQTAKLQSLIDALVKTSRLETGIIALHPASCSLGKVIQSAAQQLLPKAQEKAISLSLPDTDAQARFDPKWTEEALYNLLDNAVKYTPAGGRVQVTLALYPMFAAIQVSDTGPGIAEGEQPKVFQRFYRGRAVSQAEGVGIGLYLVRQIAQGQGGYVKLTSQPGQGSTFSLYLPRDPANLSTLLDS